MPHPPGFCGFCSRTVHRPHFSTSLLCGPLQWDWVCVRPLSLNHKIRQQERFEKHRDVCCIPAEPLTSPRGPGWTDRLHTYTHCSTSLAFYGAWVSLGMSVCLFLPEKGPCLQFFSFSLLLSGWSKHLLCIASGHCHFHKGVGQKLSAQLTPLTRHIDGADVP